MTIIALIQLAIQIWQWWQKNHVKEPSVVASSEEPIDLETQDDDN
jgi:hypothetical protein